MSNEEMTLTITIEQVQSQLDYSKLAWGVTDENHEPGLPYGYGETKKEAFENYMEQALDWYFPKEKK